MAAALLLAGSSADAAPTERMPLTHVAVIVYPGNAAAKSLVGTAQARLEQILLDNGVEVSDRDDSQKIKSIWKKLEDPGYFVTADDFVKNTSRYQLDGIVRVYFSVDAKEVMRGFFSATAQADVRLVDENAKVQSQVSFPMGAPGRPPSDGLTAQAATLNAVQRAVDEAAQTLGLTITEPASPRAVLFTLEGPLTPPADAKPVEPPPDADDSYVKLAALTNGHGTTEDVTCADRAPGGDVAAVGGSLTSTARGRRDGPRITMETDPNGRRRMGMQGGSDMGGVGARMYGSRVHLVDVAQKREITAFDTQELGPKPRDHRGSSSVLDCRFVHSWRYLASLTGDVLAVWDTERGLKLADVLLPFGADQASIEMLQGQAGFFLRVKAEGSKQVTYQLVPKAGGKPSG